MKVTKTLIFFWWGWGIIKKLSNHNLAFRKMIFFLKFGDSWLVWHKIEKGLPKEQGMMIWRVFLKKPYLYNRTFSQNFIANVQLWIKSIFSSILGKHIDKASYRTYCLMGDGESMEGNVWEALNFAGKYLNQLFFTMLLLTKYLASLKNTIWILYAIVQMTSICFLPKFEF